MDGERSWAGPVTDQLLPPTFFLIGATKSGSTALFEFMSQHPDVHRGRLKEPHFFAVEGNLPPEVRGADWLVDTWDDYLALYRGARSDQARGDGSMAYLHSAGVAERVHARVPAARLLAILRHPVEAIWSHYAMLRRNGSTSRPLEQLIAEEPREPLAPPWALEPYAMLRMRYYHHHLLRWREVFPAEQLLVLLYEDFERDADGVVRHAWAHVGVDPTAPLDVSERHNVGSDRRSWTLHRFDTRPGRVGRVVKSALRDAPGRSAVQARVRRWNHRPIPEMPAQVRRRLLDVLRADTDALEGLLDRDLSAWKR